MSRWASPLLRWRTGLPRVPTAQSLPDIDRGRFVPVEIRGRLLLLAPTGRHSPRSSGSRRRYTTLPAGLGKDLHLFAPSPDDCLQPVAEGVACQVDGLPCQVEVLGPEVVLADRGMMVEHRLEELIAEGPVVDGVDERFVPGRVDQGRRRQLNAVLRQDDQELDHATDHGMSKVLRQ